MSKARETLDELLARGEITEDEYDKRAAKLDAVQEEARNRTQKGRIETIDRFSSGWRRFWISVGAFCLLVILANEGAGAWYFTEDWGERESQECIDGGSDASACICSATAFVNRSFRDRFPMYALWDLIWYETAALPMSSRAQDIFERCVYG